MACIAVIDTETNWHDQVMSVGAVIAEAKTLFPIAAGYYVFPEACRVGGMYAHALFLETPVRAVSCSRQEAMDELTDRFRRCGISAIFAYNARFDKTHLPELKEFQWYDIMRLAAYRQYNPSLPADADFCSTGRLRRRYGVEAILRLLSGDCRYEETHNAVLDALDELEIMRLLGHPADAYIPL